MKLRDVKLGDSIEERNTLMTILERNKDTTLSSWYASYPHNLDKIEVNYFEQGNFTVCLMSDDGNMSIGVAKRHPAKDEKHTDVGRKLSFYRAAKNFIRE